MSFSNDKTRQISYHVLNFPEWRKIIHKKRLRLPVLANILPHRWYCDAWKHKTLPLPESDPSYRLDNLLPDIFYRKHRQDYSHCGLQRVLFEVPGLSWLSAAVHPLIKSYSYNILLYTVICKRGLPNTMQTPLSFTVFNYF